MHSDDTDLLLVLLLLLLLLLLLVLLLAGTHLLNIAGGEKKTVWSNGSKCTMQSPMLCFSKKHTFNFSYFLSTIWRSTCQKLFFFETNGSISGQSVELFPRRIVDFKAICLSVNKCTVNWIGTDLNISQVASLLQTSILCSDNPFFEISSNL